MGQASKEMPSTTTKANPRKYVKKENKSKKKLEGHLSPAFRDLFMGLYRY